MPKVKEKPTKGAKPVYIISPSIEPTPWDLAEEKAKDPMMTTAGNPLAEDPQMGLEERIVRTNMDRLHQDAKRRRGPNGAVYAGFMQQRFGG